MTFDDVCACIVTRGDVDMEWTKDLPYGEVIVWDNLVECDQKVYGRYAAAERTKRPLVYFQDDDVRFHEHQGLLDSYQPGVLVSNMYDDWIEDCGYHDLALVGLGSIMDNGLWKEPLARYAAAHFDDKRFSLDCDFIFGALARWKRIDFGHEILDIASDDSRLWKQEGQFEGKWRSIHRARALRKVVLAIMAKDEERNITRALSSAVGLFDSVLLLDTGSTDGTVALAQGWCNGRGIPFAVKYHPFTNFAETRNRLLAEASLRGDYILLMDGDESFVSTGVEPVSSWPELSADGYALHYEGGIDNGHVRLLNRNFPWTYGTSPVHAVIEVEGDMTPQGVNLRAPLIRHHGETRHGTTKVLRDIEILTEEIEAGREVPRNLFLRGKAYEGVGRKDDAIADYEARLEFSQGDEEAYYSRFRLGVLCAEHLNNFGLAAEHLVTARAERPTRNESLRALSFYATALADATPYPEDDMVLVHRDLYRPQNQGE